jgi:hypothetical protein
VIGPTVEKNDNHSEEGLDWQEICDNETWINAVEENNF